MIHELRSRGLNSESEVSLGVNYKGLRFPSAYRADLVVEDKLIVELKAVELLMPVFSAQLLSYLRVSGKKLGLLINFNVPHVRDGIKRIVNQL